AADGEKGSAADRRAGWRSPRRRAGKCRASWRGRAGARPRRVRARRCRWWRSSVARTSASPRSSTGSSASAGQSSATSRGSRATGKTVLVAANKVDAARLEAHAGEFHRFGFADVLPVSAETGDGVAELLDALVGDLPPPEEVGGADEEDAAQRREVRLAIVGR